MKSLKREGIHEPFPIQAATLPDTIAGRDVLGRGSTGSGKTLAFGLAMLTRLVGSQPERAMPLGLILVPTRELAMQVNDALAPHADAVDVSLRIVAGGMPYKKQIDALRRGVHVLVATPGRLMDLIEKGEADLSGVRMTVLDEADQMADLGFLPIVQQILDLTRSKGQRLLFSATLDRGVDGLVKKYLKNPIEHATAPATASVTTLEHHVMMVHPLDKDVVSAQIAARDGRTIFFVRTQAGADALTDKLISQGIAAGSLHGGKTQSVRTRTLKAFKEGVTTTLVATDVAARGIHIDDISLVVHFDVPGDHKDYLHRAGRTARAGEAGVSVMLANPRHQHQVTRLTDRAGIKPTFVRVRPSSPELIAVTGAQEPTGIPWNPPSFRDRQGSPRRGGMPVHGKPRSRDFSKDRSERPRREGGREGEKFTRPERGESFSRSERRDGQQFSRPERRDVERRGGERRDGQGRDSRRDGEKFVSSRGPRTTGGKPEHRSGGAKKRSFSAKPTKSRVR